MMQTLFRGLANSQPLYKFQNMNPWGQNIIQILAPGKLLAMPIPNPPILEKVLPQESAL